VQDNGIGLEMQHAERVLGMFERLHEIGKYPGNGMGLALAKRILERHAGKIWLDSLPGSGTTVFFTLREASVET
jgi:light-regulated signal transduction histidine kinase (bacteriophytochrome)